MSRLADPTTCPDCRAPLDSASTCTGCGLRLAGPSGERLWQLMVSADRLVEEIRATPLVPVTASAPADRVPVAPYPVAPQVASRPPARRLPALSVPVVLLSLGALCLLVAGVVFVAIAWGSLGLTGRTLTLVGVTAVFGAAAALVTRRGLRAAAESCWAVVAGMLSLDLLGARASGLVALDEIGWRAMTLLLGGALLALGAGVALWARRTPVRRLVVPQVAAALGTLVAAAGVAWTAPRPEVGTALAVPVLVALALLLIKRLPSLAHVLLGFAAFSWAELAGVGLMRAEESAAWSTWWTDLRGWPLLVAAAYAAAATTARNVPQPLRTAFAAMALAPLAVLVNAPDVAGNATLDSLREAGTLVALAALVRLAPRAWALAAAGLGLLGAAGLTLLVAWEPWTSLAALLSTAGAGSATPPVDSSAAPWAWPLLAVSVAVVLLAIRRFAPSAHRAALGQVVTVATSAVIGLALVVALVSAQAPLWLVVCAGLVSATVPAGTAWSRRSYWSGPGIAAGGATAGYLVLLALAAGVPSAALSAGSSTALATVLAVAFATSERRDEAVGPALTGGLAVAAAAYALPAWGRALHLSPMAVALVLAVYAGGVLLCADPVTRRSTSRVTLELMTIVPAAVAAALAPTLPDLAMVLTLVGSAIAVVAVRDADRRPLSWLGVGLLGCATLIRFVTEVQAPELYTLPAALLLLGAGFWRLRNDPESDSREALGSGLALALVPSLLLTLEDPISTRGVLVAAAGVATLVLGVRERLGTPLLVGSGTTALLALRELQPLSDAVPRWASLALLGVALLAVGITWESRLRNLRAAGRYLVGLR